MSTPHSIPRAPRFRIGPGPAGILTVALAIALTIALALSTTTAPATARTFNFNSVGSMTQQPLPPQWACALQRATSNQPQRFHCK